MDEELLTYVEGYSTLTLEIVEHIVKNGQLRHVLISIHDDCTQWIFAARECQ